MCEKYINVPFLIDALDKLNRYTCEEDIVFKVDDVYELIMRLISEKGTNN